MSDIMRNKLLGLTDSTYGTPTDPSTGDGIYAETFTPPSGTRNSVTNAEEMGVGLQTRRCETDYPEDTASFVIKVPGAGTKFLEILASCLGPTGYVAATGSPEVGANTHTMTLIKVLNSPIWKTLAYDEGTDVKAFNSCVVKSVSIELADAILKATVSFVGTNMTKQSGFTNAVTFDDPVDCFTFGNGAYCRVADNDQATLTSADNNPCTGLTMMLDRGYTPVEPTIGNYVISDEVDNTQPIFTLTLNYGKKATQNAGFLDDHQQGAKKMIELFFQGSIIPTTTTARSITVKLPHMELIEPPTFDVATPTAVTAVFQAFDAVTAPTPMPGITLPTFIIVNETADIGY